MNRILCLETATKNCSVAVFEDGKLIGGIDEYNENYSHSERLTVLIEKVLSDVGLNPGDLDAICVGKGPGSYTGLRIGVAVAKGMCYALKIPLLSMDSCSILFEGAKQRFPGYRFYVPMIDARRDEVYMAVFQQTGELLKPVSAKVIAKNSFDEFDPNDILLIGDGADKFTGLFKHIIIEENFRISASDMGSESLKKLLKKDIEDTAYFEPFYLKEFIAGKPRKFFT